MNYVKSELYYMSLIKSINIKINLDGLFKTHHWTKRIQWSDFRLTWSKKHINWTIYMITCYFSIWRKSIVYTGLSLADPGGVPGVGIPLFWPINAFKWGHIVGTPLPLSWVGTPLFKMAGSAPVCKWGAVQ